LPNMGRKELAGASYWEKKFLIREKRGKRKASKPSSPRGGKFGIFACMNSTHPGDKRGGEERGGGSQRSYLPKRKRGRGKERPQVQAQNPAVPGKGK